MSTFTTTRSIDLGQLTDELGGVGLSLSDNGTERTITCHADTITQDMLEAAIEAHVPAPSAPTDAEVIANLKARLLAVEQTQDQIIVDALMGDFPPL